MLENAQDQRSGEIGRLRVGVGFPDVILERALGISSVGLQLEEDFQGELAGQVAPSH